MKLRGKDTDGLQTWKNSSNQTCPKVQEIHPYNRFNTSYLKTDPQDLNAATNEILTTEYERTKRVAELLPFAREHREEVVSFLLDLLLGDDPNSQNTSLS
jgi:hypothetical protein